MNIDDFALKLYIFTSETGIDRYAHCADQRTRSLLISNMATPNTLKQEGISTSVLLLMSI